MIFRIRLPRLENLFDIDNGDRSDVGRSTVGPPAIYHDGDDGGYIYQNCSCVCNLLPPEDYFRLDSFFHRMFWDY